MYTKHIQGGGSINASIISISSHCTRLQSLDVLWCPQLSDVRVRVTASCEMPSKMSWWWCKFVTVHR